MSLFFILTRSGTGYNGFISRKKIDDLVNKTKIIEEASFRLVRNRIHQHCMDNMIPDKRE
jgi:hypothetical protein